MDAINPRGTGELPEWSVHEWTEQGFDRQTATAWYQNGYQAQSAKALRDAGVTVDDIERWAVRGWRGNVIAPLVNAANLGDFRTGRWNELLEAWRPASVGYMIEQGFTLEETERWVDAGMASPANVQDTVDAGGTVDQAASMIACGIPAASIPTAVKANLTDSDVTAWGALHLDDQTLAIMWRDAASPLQVSQLLALGATPDLLRQLPLSRLSGDQAMAWVRQGLKYSPRDYVDIGVSDSAVAQAWERDGFKPNLIRGFVKVGLGPAEAAQKVRQGFTDWDIENGQVTPPLLGIPWSRVIRKSRAEDFDYVLAEPEVLPEGMPPDIFERFWYAVEFLAEESTSSSGMFSSSTRTFTFADGCIYRNVSAYGWGSREGTWISGGEAMQLLCVTMGLKPPRHFTPKPPRDWEPADDALGQAGFTRYQAAAIAEAGMSVEQALAWRAEGVDPSWVSKLAGLDASTVKDWLRLGIHPFNIPDLIKQAVPLTAARSLLEAGCPDSDLADFLLAEVDAPKYTAYLAAGVASDLARVLAAHHIGPDGAQRWQELGFRTWDAAPLLAAGGGIEWADALVPLRVSLQDLERWARTHLPIEECKAWLAEGITADVAADLAKAGIDPKAAGKQWRKGRHRPETIIKHIGEDPGPKAGPSSPREPST